MWFSLEGVFLSSEINSSRVRHCSFACPLVALVSAFIKARQRRPGGFAIRPTLLSTTDKALSDRAPSACLASASSPLHTSSLLHPACRPGPSSFRFLKQTLQTLQHNRGSTLHPLPAQPLSFPLCFALISAHTPLPSQKASLGLRSLDTCRVVMSHGTLHFPAT